MLFLFNLHFVLTICSVHTTRCLDKYAPFCIAVLELSTDVPRNGTMQTAQSSMTHIFVRVWVKIVEYVFHLLE